MHSISKTIQVRQNYYQGLSFGDPLLSNNNFWMKPFSTHVNQDEQSSFSGFKAKAMGMTLGWDAEFKDFSRLGAAASYAKTFADGSAQTAQHNLKIDSYQLTAYGTYGLNERTNLSFQASIGLNKNVSERQVSINNTTATANYKSYTSHIGVGLERSYELDNNNQFIAALTADYLYIKDESYTESGADLLNLNLNDRSAKQFLVGFDGKVIHQVDDDLSLIASLGIGYDLLNEETRITSAFAGAPSSPFTTEGPSPDPWLTHISLGLNSTAFADVDISAQFDLEYREGFLSETASIKLSWSF